MGKCIRLDIECAVICYAAAQLMSLCSDKTKTLCKICADLCDACVSECMKHDNEHCKECADALLLVQKSLERCNKRFENIYFNCLCLYFN